MATLQKYPTYAITNTDQQAMIVKIFPFRIQQKKCFCFDKLQKTNENNVIKYDVIMKMKVI